MTNSADSGDFRGPRTMVEHAQAMSDAFERRTRDNGDVFYALKDDAPQWMTDVVYTAHGGRMLPDDWRYECVADVCAHLADGNDPDDAHDFADSYVDVYTSARLAWLASDLGRADYCDEAASELGDDSAGLIERIGYGQYAEASEVFSLVVQALQELADEANDDDDEDDEQ